jgi:hypothetical protein
MEVIAKLDIGNEKKREISEVKIFTSEGMQVTAFCPVIEDGESQSDLTLALFQGTVGVNTQRGPVEFGFEFPSTYSLGECFEKFEETAEAAVEAAQRKAQEQNLIVTPGASSDGILVP